MKKALFICFLSSIAFGSAKAQQIEQYSQFMLNEFRVNSAVAGINNYFNATAVYRNQWVGIDGAPVTYYLGVNGPIIRDNMGIGGYVYSDVAGHTRRNGFQLAYAYHLKLNDILRLSFSLAGGFQQFSIDGNRLDLQNSNDIALSNGLMNELRPDIGAAVRFSGEHFHVGIAAPQVVGGKLQFFDDYPETQSALSRHFMLNGAYTYNINDNFSVEAGGLGKYETESTLGMIDVYARGFYKDMVWLGALYRSWFPVIYDKIQEIPNVDANSIGIMAGYKFQNNLMIGYAYDIPTGSIAGSTTGSHELLLAINFSKRNPRPVVTE